MWFAIYKNDAIQKASYVLGKKDNELLCGMFDLRDLTNITEKESVNPIQLAGDGFILKPVMNRQNF